MTIDFRPVVSPSLFDNSNTIRLLRPDINSYPELAALTFCRLSSEPSSLASIRTWCFEQASALIAKTLPGYELWLYVAHSAWQPDNRITRFHALWRSLLQQDLVLPSWTPEPEVILESAHGIRFLGRTKVTNADIPAACKILDVEPVSILLALENGVALGVQELIPTWMAPSSPPQVYWRDLAFSVCGRKGIVFRPFGVFDDREVGTDLILRRQDLTAFVQQR